MKIILMNSKRYIIRTGLYLFILFNLSCSTSAEDIIIGAWTINSLNYKGDNIFEGNVLTNIVSFNSDNSFRAPIIGSPLSNNDLLGSWHFISSNQIELKNKNKYLNGVFVICFREDKERGYLVMELSNNDLLLSMGKILSPSEFTLIPINCND